jgi:ferredoxin-thioredoxin reductase catalytic subunit
MIKDRSFFEKFAEENGFELSLIADKVITAINKKNGNCPCRINPVVVCPCPMHKEEIETMGRCTCNLFVKKEN